MFNIYILSFRIDIIINNLYQLPKTTLLLLIVQATDIWYCLSAWRRLLYN